MPVHMDGARFANAVVALGCTPAELTWKAGVDALSFGGTKNGLMGVEAVILFDPARAWEFELRRKRAGHLFSKHRYLSAQMEAYLADDLWRDMARTRQRPRGAAVGRGSRGCPARRSSIRPRSTRSSRAGRAPAHRAREDAGARYYLWSFAAPQDQTLDGPDDAAVGARLVCGWATDEAEIDRFLGLIEAEKVADRA